MPSHRQDIEPRPSNAKNQSASSRSNKKRKTEESPPAEDMGNREAFLARNRMAATKSRQKKREWTQTLEENLRSLQSRNKELKFQVGMLKQDIVSMKSLCLQHFDCDCASIRAYMNQSLANIITDGSAVSPTNSAGLSPPIIPAEPAHTHSREASHESFRFDLPSASSFQPQLPVQQHGFQMSSPAFSEPQMIAPASTRHNSSAESVATTINDDVFSIGNQASSGSEMSPVEPCIDPALCDVNLMGETATEADLKAVWDQLVGDDFDSSMDPAHMQPIAVQA